MSKADIILIVGIVIITFISFYGELKQHEEVHRMVCEDFAHENATIDYNYFSATTTCNLSTEKTTKQERLLFKQTNIQNEIEAYNWLGTKAILAGILIFTVFIFMALKRISDSLEFFKYRAMQKDEKGERINV